MSMMKTAKVSFLFFIAIILIIFTASAENNILTDRSGKIDDTAFTESVPSIMDIGKGYTITVPVTNTGNETADFGVLLIYDWEYFYFNETFIIKKLKIKESGSFEFTGTPHKPYTGNQKIIARLYGMEGENYKELDEVSDSVVLLREKTISFESLMLPGMILFVLIITFRRYL